MKTYLKALAAGAFILLATGSASAQVRFNVYVGEPQPYYPPAVKVWPQYAPPAGYYREQDDYVVPAWRARQEWREMREREWRRAEWQRRNEWRRRHEAWHRHEEWHREHWPEQRFYSDDRD